jgi:hypothetical protein
MEIDYRIVGVGWASVTVSHLGHTVEFKASYLTDVMGELVAGAILALPCEDEVRFSWELEPGELRWILTPIDGQLRVQVLAFRDFLDHADDEDGRDAFRCELPSRGFAQAVAVAAEQVLRELGFDGYRERWVEHDFPIDSLDELRDLLLSSA